jgi:hypothetical protein
VTIPGYLDSTEVSIPPIMQPVAWDTTFGISTNIDVLDVWIEEYSRLLTHDAAIDEAAVMVPSHWHAGQFIDKLTGSGWEHFNSADDLVYTNPFGTRYFVHYDFLRSPEIPWRLEVMTMGEGRLDGARGFSPLHQALWTPDGITRETVGGYRYPVPHLSFKAPRRTILGTAEPKLQTPQQAYSKAVERLQARGCIHAQTCQSTYGTFGYYLPGDATRQLYIKPRVNLRDDA